MLVVLDVVGELAADAAVRAEAVDRRGRAVGRARPRSSSTDAGIRAPVGQAWTHSPQATQVLCAHRVVEVEDDLLVMAAAGHADDVVDLDLAAGADAEVAVDAGVELHRHRRMAAVGRRRARRAGKRLASTPTRSAQRQNFESGSCARRARGLVGQQQLEDHPRAAVGARSSRSSTFMPGVGLRMHEAASTRSPSISTMQARQLPSGR